jgi:hypothetical protein
LQTLVHSSDLEFGETVGGLAEIDRGQVLAVGRAGGVMAITEKAEGAGASRPSELALLGRTFDRLKVEAQSEKRHEMLASRIVASYPVGRRTSRTSFGFETTVGTVACQQAASLSVREPGRAWSYV